MYVHDFYIWGYDQVQAKKIKKYESWETQRPVLY